MSGGTRIDAHWGDAPPVIPHALTLFIEHDPKEKPEAVLATLKEQLTEELRAKVFDLWEADRLPYRESLNIAVTHNSAGIAERLTRIEAVFNSFGHGKHYLGTYPKSTSVEERRQYRKGSETARETLDVWKPKIENAMAEVAAVAWPPVTITPPKR